MKTKSEHMLEASSKIREAVASLQEIGCPEEVISGALAMALLMTSEDSPEVWIARCRAAAAQQVEEN